MDVFLRVVGVVVLFTVMLDIFVTVLFPSVRYGPVFKPVSRSVWFVFRSIGKLTAGQKRRNLLSYSGPVLIVTMLTVWLFLLITGWAMIYKPALGSGIRASLGVTDPSWMTAVYFSAFNLTTLGVGDITAENGTFRLLSVVQAATGFTFFSMVTTYFLSVYSSLTGRNAFAQKLHHLTGAKDDALELLIRLADGPDLAPAREHLSSAADFLQQIYQTHRSYPVLRFFHYRESYYSLPQILFIVLESTALLRSTLDPERYFRVTQSSALNELFDSATFLLHELIPDVQPPPPSSEDREIWRRRYVTAVARLARAGIHVRDNLMAGADEYVDLRGQWDLSVRELAASMLYDKE